MDRGELDIPELTEVSWRNNLADFDRDVWPWFEKHGYAKGDAFIIWTLNKLDNDIDKLTEIVGTLTDELREVL